MNVKKNSCRPKYAKHFLSLSENEQLTKLQMQQLQKTFSQCMFIVTTSFDKCFLLYVTTGSYCFLIKFTDTLRFFSIAMLLFPLKQVL